MDIQNTLDDIESQTQSPFGGVEGFEVVLQRFCESLCFVDDLQPPSIYRDSDMFIAAIFDTVIEQIFDHQCKEFEVHFDDVVFVECDTHQPFGVLYHQQVDTRFDQIAHLVGVDVEFKVFGSDLFDLGKLVDKQIEPLKDTVHTRLALFVRKHLAHEPPFGDRGLELMHGCAQKELP